LTRIYSYKELISAEFPPQPRYLGSESEPLLIKGGKAILFGLFSVGKSFLVENLACCLASGRSFLGFQVPEPARVLYIENEIPEPFLKSRLEVMGKDFDQNLLASNLLLTHQPTLCINTPDGHNELVRLLRRTMPDVLILDCLYWAVVGDISDGAVANDLIRSLNTLYDLSPELCILIVHHARKAVAGRPDLGFEEMLGSVQLNNWPDTRMRLTRPAGSKSHYLALRTRHAPDIETMELRFNPETFLFSRVMWAKKKRVLQVAKMVRELLLEGELSYRSILTTMNISYGVSVELASQALDYLTSIKAVEAYTDQEGTKYYRLSDFNLDQEEA